MDKFELVLDSSQITCFLECPEKWHNYYVKRLRPLNYVQDENMNAGIYGHKLLDIYYRMRSQNCSKDAILLALDRYKPDNDLCECGCAQEFHIDVPMFKVIECQRCKKCYEFRPKQFVLATIQRNKVRTSLRYYIEKYNLEGDFQPLSPQHIELGFSNIFYEDDENVFSIEGRFDLMAKLQGLDCIADHKFQSRAYQLYNKSIQFKNYILASGFNTLVINYIRLHDNKTAESYAREVVSMNHVELEAWRQRLIKIFFRIKKNMQATEYEHNWNECQGGFTGKHCWYTQLCEESDTQVASRKEKTLYKIDENIWRPW